MDKFWTNPNNSGRRCIRMYKFSSTWHSFGYLKIMMKKIVLMATLAVTLAGCASLQNKRPNYRQVMVGDWMLNDIDVEGQEGSFRITLFNEALLDCFKGSAWSLDRKSTRLNSSH